MIAVGEGAAPGKVILFGEHAVVYGHPAVVAPLDLGLRARVRLGGAATTINAPLLGAQHEAAIAGVRALAAHLGAGELAVEVSGDLPVAAGLGSSAALGVSVARAVADAQERVVDHFALWSAAMALEEALHGRPSGVDVAAAVWARPLLFRRGSSPEIAPLTLLEPVWLVIALTDEQRSTAQAVAALAERRARAPGQVEGVLAQLGTLAAQGAQLLERADRRGLGILFDEAHAHLAALGVSTPALDALCAKLRAAGALGAKLTGAGGGGAVIAVCEDPLALVRAMRDQGVRCFSQVITP